MASNDEKLLLCPKCKEIMSSPIYQCSSGHSVCGKCKKKSETVVCPLCNNKVTEMRNHQFEQLIETMKFKIKIDCKYKYKGCTYKIKATDKKLHEKECRYNEHKCEANNFLNAECNWKGSFDDIYEHFRENHVENTKGSFKHSGVFKIDKDWKNLQVTDFSNGLNVFYSKIHVNCTKQKVFYWCKMVGLETLARHYYYEFEIYHEDVKKIKFSNYCNSHAMPDENIIDNENCAIFSFNQLKNFQNENNEISYRYRIMKCH